MSVPLLLSALMAMPTWHALREDTVYTKQTSYVFCLMPTTHPRAHHFSLTLPAVSRSPPPAHASPGPGSSNITNCTCNVGYTGPDGGTCQACEAGKYKGVNGSAACAFCAGPHRPSHTRCVPSVV